MDSKDSSDWADAQADQICVFTGHTGHFVGFVMLWFKLWNKYYAMNWKFLSCCYLGHC